MLKHGETVHTHFTIKVLRLVCVSDFPSDVITDHDSTQTTT